MNFQNKINFASIALSLIASACGGVHGAALFSDVGDAGIWECSTTVSSSSEASSSASTGGNSVSSSSSTGAGGTGATGGMNSVSSTSAASSVTASSTASSTGGICTPNSIAQECLAVAVKLAQMAGLTESNPQACGLVQDHCGNPLQCPDATEACSSVFDFCGGITPVETGYWLPPPVTGGVANLCGGGCVVLDHTAKGQTECTQVENAVLCSAGSVNGFENDPSTWSAIFSNCVFDTGSNQHWPTQSETTWCCKQ